MSFEKFDLIRQSFSLWKHWNYDETLAAHENRIIFDLKSSSICGTVEYLFEFTLSSILRWKVKCDNDKDRIIIKIVNRSFWFCINAKCTIHLLLHSRRWMFLSILPFVWMKSKRTKMKTKLKEMKWNHVILLSCICGQRQRNEITRVCVLCVWASIEYCDRV